MALARDADEHQGIIELGITRKSSRTNDSSGNIDIDDKIHEAYDQDEMRGRDRKDNSSFKGARKDGHQRLASDADDDFEPRDGSVATTEVIENSGAAAGQGDEGPGTVYKVYKRRWFGLAQLTLINLVISWDWLTFSPVSQHAAKYYGHSESDINWFSTAFLFSFVVISPLTIYMLHWGPKQSIVTAAVFTILGNVVRVAGSHSRSGGNYGVVMFGQILIGLAQPFVLSAPTRYSDLWFTNRGRVAATALPSLANPFGAAIGQLVVPFIATSPPEVSNAVLYVTIIYAKGVSPGVLAPAQIHRAVADPDPLRRIRSFFNSISSLLNQILLPYGFTSDDAGIAGAVLIVVGLVASAISSPILDRTKAFILAIKVAVPIIGLSYLAFIFVPPTRELAGPYVILAVLGAASFSLVPVALEFLCELSHPMSPEITSTIAWGGGQLLGGIFILISDALKAGPKPTRPPISAARSSSRPCWRSPPSRCPCVSASSGARTSSS
ncbi:hypothetical protein EKO27_g11401 [Xylaria grammica]|uniref:Major facilitator superfamily (MFS) profile domain-containing protein n=1 Tax=Xylaria grammica TaxID=363999 RepID=A0A439CNG8_9PEZI|nr:hypothetical protein EKO27_g11401 [Xylaria grammica]